MPSDLVLLLLLSSCSLLLCDDSKNIKLTTGDDVTLVCWLQVSQDDVIKVEWKKPDLKSKRYIFYFSDKHFNGDYQDERFRGRVELRDPEMKNGDVSIVLKNVSINDSGTYECRVSVQLSGRRQEPELVSVVRLTVREPGHTDGQTDKQIGGVDQGGGDQGGRDQGGGDKHGRYGLIAVGLVFGVVATGFILVSIRQKP